jgi:cation diffusion facilitator family transporter
MNILTPGKVTWLGLIFNVLLALLKIIIGLLFNSQALFADGLHSISDIISDVAVLAGIRIAEKPADGNHPYGHLRISTLVAMFIGLLLLGASIWIVYSAIITLHDSNKQVQTSLPFWVALASIPVKEFLFQITRIVGRKTSNIALIANAWHHRTDALTSLAAAAGLAGVAFGGPDWAFLDRLTAVVLSAFLFVVAVKIIYKAATELIDQAPDTKVLAEIEEIISKTDGVHSYHAIRARIVGGKVEMDLHIQVDPGLSVQEGHDIATDVRSRVLLHHPNVVEIIVHIEPADPH